MRSRTLAAILAVFVSVSGAHAQSAEFSMEQLYLECLEGKCVQAAGGILRELRRESDNSDFLSAQYGYVALAAFQAARASDARQNHVQAAAVLRGLARLTTQEAQGAIFGEVGQAILRGNVEIFDQENPFVASPSTQPPNDARIQAAARRDALVKRLRERRSAWLDRLRARQGRG